MRTSDRTVEPGANFPEYEKILEHFMPPSQQDFFLVKVTVPIALVVIFLIIFFIIFLKCRKRPKKCTALRTDSLRSSRSDGTVTSTWRRVKPNDLAERKLPPIPEETQEDDTGQGRRDDISPTTADDIAEGHVYAEIHDSVTEEQETNPKPHQMRRKQALHRPQDLNIHSYPDLVQSYIHLTPVQTPEEPKTEISCHYVPYIYPYHDLRECADNASPYHTTSFTESPRRGVRSGSPEQRRKGSPKIPYELRGSFRKRRSSTKFGSEHNGPDQGKQVRAIYCRKCSKEISPELEGKKKLSETCSLDSGNLGCSHSRVNPSGSFRTVKRLQMRHDKKERARLISSVKLALADRDKICDYYSTF